MAKSQLPNTSEWKTLARNDWGEILELSRTKAFQRKFQIVEAFTKLVAEKGYHQTTHKEIADACKVTRQLVRHHFPNDRALMILTYRYIYARFQKHAADALVSRQAVLDQFQAYVLSIPSWVRDFQSDARFLTNFFGIAPVYPELATFLERNTKIGQARIHTLLIRLREENQIGPLSDEALKGYASSVQYQIFGYIILNSEPKKVSVESAKQKSDELWRSCLAIVKK
jgi:AcrR family transcriptional regulator